MEAAIVYWGYIGIVEKNIDIFLVYNRVLMNCRSLGFRFQGIRA